MKKITCILLCLMAFASGSAAGFYVSKNRLTKKHEKEIKSIKESFKGQVEWSLKLHGVDTNKKDVKPEVQTVKTNNTETKVNDDAKIREEQLKYNNLKSEYTPDTSTKKNDVYLITEDEFNETMYNYSTLHYYAGDAVLADDSNNRQNNIKQLIGDIDLEAEFKKPGATPSIFVRNELTEEDYEIVLIDEKWENIATPAQKAQALNVG